MKEIKKIKVVILITAALNFLFYNFAFSIDTIDTNEEMKQYLSKLNPVLINVQVATRNINQQLVGPVGALKNMDTAIQNIKAINPPEIMKRQHKMILLAFKKLRMGFYLMTHNYITANNRDAFLRLMRSGRDLLRLAVQDIVGFSKKEGII